MKYIMADDFLFCSYGERKILLNKATFKTMLFTALDFSFFSSQLKSNNVIAFSQSQNRKDYQEYIDLIRVDIENSLILENVTKHKKVVNFANIFTSFIQIFISNFFFINISLKEKLFFFLKLVYYKNCITSLEASCEEVNIKTYVPFISAVFKESMYCQFFRKRQIKSYGLQHGIHLTADYYKDFIPMDIFNVENFQADYFLSWGDFMKEVFQYSELGSENVILAGNPKYSNYQKINISKNDLKTCIVCLARNLYNVQNKDLLNIAGQLSKTGVKVYVKFHPKNNVADYSEILNHYDLEILEVQCSIAESVKSINPDFAIIYNSTVYYEYYINNVITFRYTKDERDIPFGMNDGFNDFQQLMSKIVEIKNLDIEKFNIEVNNFINSFFKLGTNNYKAILNE